MIFRRIAALLLCMLMAATALTGCVKTPKSPFVSSDPVNTESATEIIPQPVTLNFESAHAAFDLDTVMMTVNGKDLTWSELFYYIYSLINFMQQQGVSISSWSAEYSGGMSYMDYVLSNIMNYILDGAAVEYGAVQTDASISQEDLNAIQSVWDAEVDSAGGEEALIAQIEAEYGTKEIFMKNLETTYLKNACFITMYGENGSKLTDAEVADNTAEDGYLMAKHILFKTFITDDSGGGAPMSDTEKAAVREKAEGILAQLNSYAGDDFDAFFDELMVAYSEDTGGLAGFPQGYLFQDGDMVTAFYEEAAALEIGRISDIVETEIGYHVIYRIPINYDTTPMAYYNYGAYSLRYVTAASMFNAVVESWKNSLNVVCSDAYKSLDFDRIFAGG